MLPQNPQGMTNTDRILLESVKTQTENLSAQTRVLHKLSDSITAHRRETSNIRKDLNELRREFFTGNNKTLSDIKKFFEKSKTTKFSEPKIGSKTKEDDKGFFRNALSKLFGPSKYQQKIMDDSTAIREYQDLIYQDINFIRHQYEEPARARERELLAQAIADKLDMGGEGGGGKSMLGALAGALLGGLTSLVGLLWNQFSDILGKIWDTLKSILEWSKINAGKPTIPPGAPGGGGQGGPGQGGPGQGTPGGGGGRPGTPIPTPQGPAQPELPNPQQRLPAPGEQGRPQLPAPGGPAQDAEIKREGPRGTESGKKPNPFEDIRKNPPGSRPGRPGPVFEPGGGGRAILRRILGILGIGAIGAAGMSVMGDNVNDNLDVNQSATEEAMAQQQSLTLDFNQSMKKAIESLMGFDDAIEAAQNAVDEAFTKTAVPLLDKIGEITIGKERVNLLPNLGTSLQEVLKEEYEIFKNLKDSAKEAAAPYINNVINNMSNNTESSSIPFVAASSTAAGSAIKNYNTRQGRIR